MTPDANGGPYVQVAVLCSTFIRGAESGQLSLINIIEGATVTGPDPDSMPPTIIGPPLKLVISLLAGETKGRYSLSLRPQAPSGLQSDLIQLPPLQFSSTGSRGVDTILPMPPYEITEQGTHWFDVLLSPGAGQPRLLTRIPFTVVYQPQQAQQQA